MALWPCCPVALRGVAPSCTWSTAAPLTYYTSGNESVPQILTSRPSYPCALNLNLLPTLLAYLTPSHSLGLTCNASSSRKPSLTRPPEILARGPSWTPIASWASPITANHCFEMAYLTTKSAPPPDWEPLEVRAQPDLSVAGAQVRNTWT